MRRRGQVRESVVETGADDPARFAAWDGLLGRTGPGVVIRAARAGDVVAPAPEALQVA